MSWWVIFGIPSAYVEVEVGMGIQDTAEEAIPVICPIHSVKSWLFWVSEIVIPLGNEDSPANMTINSRSGLLYWRELLMLLMLVSLDYFLKETFPHLLSAGGFPCRVKVDLRWLYAKLSDWATRNVTRVFLRQYNTWTCILLGVKLGKDIHICEYM